MNNNSIDSIGQRVVGCRKEKGMTQVELVKLTGLSEQTITNLEKEHIPPSLSTVIKVSKVFGVTLDWLVFGKGSKFRKC